MAKLEISNYITDGVKLRVRLKCSCGCRRILKLEKNNEVYYRCAECKIEASLRQLKSEATTYWRGRIWEVECEERKQQLEAVGVNYPAVLDAKPSRYLPTYCTLMGHCVELTVAELVFTAYDFKKSYFQELSTGNRFASVQFTPGVKGLPGILRGSIVEIKFRDEELPVCRFRVKLQDLSDEEQKLVTSHIEDLRGRLTEWSME